MNWDKDILEPLKPKWRPATKDAPATPLHKFQSIVKPPDPSTPAEIASCGKGRGRIIMENLKEIAMGPVESSQYARKGIKQQVSWFVQEVRALRFYEPEGKEADLVCQVIAMADWAVE